MGVEPRGKAPEGREELEPPVLELPVGSWIPEDEPDRGGLGYLLMRGLMLRRVRVAGIASAELLDRGDLLRPWLEDAASFVAAEWRVLEPTSLAVLDRSIGRLAKSWPTVTGELLDRAMRRSRSLALNAAIAAERTVEDRLVLLMWHVAERRGRPDAGGVRIPLPVTHETLAHLVAARRPSVTTALRALDERGTLTRVSSDEWRLCGAPPTTPRAAAGS